MPDVSQIMDKAHQWVSNCEPGACIAVPRSDLRALLDEVKRLSETYKDSNGEVWSPPTVWAYAKLCEARTNWQARAEAAEAELARLREPAGDVGEVVRKLTARTVKVLPAEWKKDRKCPECDASADRQKCMWDMGGSCPRHDPKQYDPSPYVVGPDKDCSEAAKLLLRQAGEIEALKAEVGNPRRSEWLKTIAEHADMRHAANTRATSAEALLREAGEVMRFYAQAWDAVPTGYEGEDDYIEPSVDLRNDEGERARAFLAKMEATDAK